MTFEPRFAAWALDIKSIVFYHNVDFQLLTAEISGNLAPGLGSPLINRHSEGVVVKPFLGSAYHLEEIPILFIFNEFRPAKTFTHPFLTVQRVGIDRKVDAFLLLPSEAVDDGKKLAYVVSSAFKHRAFEQLGARLDEHAPVFHFTWITGACRVDCDGVGGWFRGAFWQ